MTDFFHLLHVVFPYMTGNYFYAFFTVCATIPVWTALATFILPISFTVCCVVMKHFVIRALIAVKEFIVYKIILFEKSFLTHRPFIWHDRCLSVFYQLAGD